MTKLDQILKMPRLPTDGSTTTPGRTKRNDTARTRSNPRPRQAQSNASAKPRLGQAQQPLLVSLADLRPGLEIAWQDEPRRVRSLESYHPDFVVLELQPRIEGKYYTDHYWRVGPVLGVLKVELTNKSVHAEKGRPPR